MDFTEFKYIMTYIHNNSKMLMDGAEIYTLEEIYERLIDMETEIFHQRIKITRALNEVK